MQWSYDPRAGGWAIARDNYDMTLDEAQLWERWAYASSAWLPPRRMLTTAGLEAFKVLCIKRRLAGDITAAELDSLISSAIRVLAEHQRKHLDQVQRKYIDRAVAAVMAGWRPDNPNKRIVPK